MFFKKWIWTETHAWYATANPHVHLIIHHWYGQVLPLEAPMAAVQAVLQALQPTAAWLFSGSCSTERVTVGF